MKMKMKMKPSKKSPKKQPKQKTKIKKVAPRKKVDTAILNVMRGVSLFKGLSSADLSKLLSKSEVKIFQRDQFIFHAGEISDGAYINLQGAFRIENNGLFLSNVDVGESVGEMGVLNDWPRSADLIAITETRALFIPKVYLGQLMAKDLKLALSIYKNAVGILGTLIKHKNIVMEFSKILDDSVLAATTADDINDLKPIDA